MVQSDSSISLDLINYHQSLLVKLLTARESTKLRETYKKEIEKQYYSPIVFPNSLIQIFHHIQIYICFY